MQLSIEWSELIPMKGDKEENFLYTFDFLKVPVAPGVYVFGRSYGPAFEALYVGKATNLRGRTRGQLNNLRLMQHLKNASNGRRYLLYGKFVSRPGQQEDVCLPILERTLIRHFLSEGHDLVNLQGTKIRRHEITSSGARGVLPRTMFLDR